LKIDELEKTKFKRTKMIEEWRCKFKFTRASK